MAMEDIAQDIELMQWERNNLNRRPTMPPKKLKPEDPGYGPAECEECGEEMPTARREWGMRLCVTCKEATEPPRLRHRA